MNNYFFIFNTRPRFVKKRYIIASKKKRKKIEKLFDNAWENGLESMLGKFTNKPPIKPQTPFQKIYLIKKLFSNYYCMEENQLIDQPISQPLYLLLRKASKVYFYFIKQTLSGFHKLMKNELLIMLAKHLLDLAKEFLNPRARVIPESIRRELKFLRNKLLSRKSVYVDETFVISGHDTTINTLLIFLLADPEDVNKSYKTIKKLDSYPPKFGSNIVFHLVKCLECESRLKVEILYDEKPLQPFFSGEKDGCDLLTFVRYVFVSLDFKMKENLFKSELVNTEF